MRIAFAGNPNSGKTSIFNVLTGAKAKVGNWSGVTVSEREVPILPQFTKQDGVVAVDLPGTYSMSPFSPEEGVTSKYVKEKKPDVIINVVDATNLSRSLFFTTQLLELGIPVVVALNKSDISAKDRTQIDTAVLSEKLHVPVVETVAVEKSHTGIPQVLANALERIGKEQPVPYRQNAQLDLGDRAAVSQADRERYSFVNAIVAAVERREILPETYRREDRADAILTNPVVGIGLFAVIMWAVFAISQTYLGPIIADWLVGWIEVFQEWVAVQLAESPALLSTVIVDGVIGGVGAVIGFLPLVMVMYFLIALLEESGYMARVSAVLDPIFKRVGLSGKSVIPIVIGTGCSIPAIMATRTIRNTRERRAAAMLTSWIPCGAKIPVIALFAGAFFGGASWVSWVSYFLGLMLIFLGALLIKGVTGHKYRTGSFIMELPRYRLPSLRHAGVVMLQRAKAFIVKAATIILVSNLAIQVMQTFTWRLQPVPAGMEDSSILATIASPLAVLLIPLGFGTWQLAAAAITGFIAKENVVGTLAVVYGLTRFIDAESFEMVGGASEIATTMGLTSVTALAYLFFNLYTPPCFAAIGAMNTEMRNKGWLFSAIGLQLAVGYTVAFLVNQVGTLLTAGHLAAGFVPGLIAIFAMAASIVAISYRIRSGFAKQRGAADAQKLVA
ncbi:MAG: ferrous iron transport protein B [Trueperella sp.]|nr:ferrous iron transport protein B [Trueperella sp.]